MYSVFIQENCSVSIFFFLFNFIMHTTVKFYAQSEFRTIKV